MKKWWGVGLVWLLFSVGGVRAHPFDEMGDVKTYDQKQILEVGRDKTKLQVEVTLYALDKIKVWEGIDKNKDREISDGERKEWMKMGQEASWLEIDGTRSSFEAVGMEVADYYEFFSPQPARIRIEFWSEGGPAVGQGGVYHYEGKDKKLEEIELVARGTEGVRVANVHKVDATAVAFSVEAGVQEEGTVLGLKAGGRVGEFLAKYVKGESLPMRLVVLAVASAFVLGALHALTPGHGKAIVAGYLIGERGTIWHAVNLGLIITVTHTASVFGLGLAALLMTAYVVPAKVVKTLSLVSGFLVLGFGLTILVQRVRRWLKKRNHGHEHDHSHVGEVAISWKNLLALGVSGGIVPCVDALAILIVAVSLQKVALGMILLLSFSGGLAAALVGGGILAVVGKEMVARKYEGLAAYEHHLGILSAVVVILLGVGLLWPGKAGAAFFTNEYTQAAPVQEQALIFFDGKRETLWVSTTFNVNPVVVGNFAWVIPVPSKPEVELVKKDIFTDLEGLTQKKFSKNDLLSELIYADIKEEVSRPSEIFSRPVNIIRWEVFGPDDSLGKLERWLTEVGYFIPKSAYPTLNNYEEKGWYFVTVEVSALHIQYSATDSLTVNGAHTLPVKIDFGSDKIIYPLKLAAAQPDLDSVDLPYSFDYGISSESVLGAKDEIVDSLLFRQSGNKWPRLPTDMANIKLDVYVLADYKVAAPDYVTIFADKVKGGEVGLDLPNQSFFLTRMYAYKPQALLDDTTIEKSPESKRVNPRISRGEEWVRILGIAAVAVLGGGYILLKGMKAGL